MLDVCHVCLAAGISGLYCLCIGACVELTWCPVNEVIMCGWAWWWLQNWWWCGDGAKQAVGLDPEMQQVTGCYQTSTLLLEKCKCLMTEKWNRCDKQPGSWIKVNAKVQSYLVAGQRHAQMSDICAEISGCQDAKVCLTSFAKWLAHFQQKFVNERILSLFLPHTHIHRQRQRQRVLVVF
jgi:hypothetical protein